MTYTEAEKLYGSLMRPIDAADEIGVKQPAINDYWNRKILKKITVKAGIKEKHFVITSEVNQLIKQREEKQKNILIKGDNNIIGNGNSINIKK